MALIQSGVFLAIVAHILIGGSLVWDKILLKEMRSRTVVNYVFWLGAMSMFGSILAFFGMKLPAWSVILTAFGAGMIHLLANYFYYWALNLGEASETLAIIGGFSPAATMLIGIPLLASRLEGLTLWGFALLTAGGFFMFLSENLPAWRVLTPVLLSAGCFGLTNVLQKKAFDQAGFIPAYVFFTIGTFVCALLFLIPKKWREEIFVESEQVEPRRKFWYFVNRFLSGVGSFLIFLAISHASPAIVDAISGVRYVVIFVGAYVLTRLRPAWLEEEFRGWTLFAKVIATGLVAAGLILASMGQGDSAPQAGAKSVPVIKASRAAVHE